MAKSSKKLGKLNIELDKKIYTKPSEGALDPNYYIKAQMKNETWHLAKIIDCRPLKDLDPKKKRNDFSYEYYVHYQDFNRRMDEWISRSRIEPTKILIEEEKVHKKRKGEEKKHENNIDDEHEGMDAASLLAHEQATKFKTIDYIQVGKHKCETWYYSPYPEGCQNVECLFICEFCLSFYVSKEELLRHSQDCNLTHPPGDEIYRHGRNSMFEIDGNKNPTYCENLSYLAKLFLDHKTLYYDVEPFLYFVLTENDEYGNHIVGYFSKEKESSNGYNLACILALPFHQRKGYGKLLITFSYELSYIEKKVGTPERPLSDLGRESYISWWTQRIIQFIRDNPENSYSIQDITKETMIHEKDIIYVLERLNLIKYTQGSYYICTDKTVIDQLYKSAGRPGVECVRDNIQWVPYKIKLDLS